MLLCVIISRAAQHCYFAGRGMQFKHIWFHKPYQQNSNAAVCDHGSIATQHCYFADRTCNSNTFGFITYS